MTDARLKHLQAFYSLLATLSARTGGPKVLSLCTARTGWPMRGVYFFMEQGEHRIDSGEGERIVRVGTHALGASSKTKLWTRLSQHRGQSNGGGDHRGSIFRLLVGTALIARSGASFPTWGVATNAAKEVRVVEQFLEAQVSAVIGAMPFLWLDVPDEPGPDSLRGSIERNAIALLSNYERPALDPPSATWLGNCCDRQRVRASGLWNSNHVMDDYDPSFLDALSRLVASMSHT